MYAHVRHGEGLAGGDNKISGQAAVCVVLILAHTVSAGNAAMV